MRNNGLDSGSTGTQGRNPRMKNGNFIIYVKRIVYYESDVGFEGTEQN